MGNILYTIGHSNHKAVEFLQLLKSYSITAVVDVRSSPFSCMNPQYNQNTLSTFLNENSIAYVFLGKEPLICHRTVLIGQYIATLGVCVDHILASGQSESHQEATQRLLDELDMQNNELFRSQDEVINEALLKREQDIAYSKKI